MWHISKNYTVVFWWESEFKTKKMYLIYEKVQVKGNSSINALLVFSLDHTRIFPIGKVVLLFIFTLHNLFAQKYSLKGRYVFSLQFKVLISVFVVLMSLSQCAYYHQRKMNVVESIPMKRIFLF